MSISKSPLLAMASYDQPLARSDGVWVWCPYNNFPTLVEEDPAFGSYAGTQTGLFMGHDNHFSDIALNPPPTLISPTGVSRTGSSPADSASFQYNSSSYGTSPLVASASPFSQAASRSMWSDSAPNSTLPLPGHHTPMGFQHAGADMQAHGASLVSTSRMSFADPMYGTSTDGISITGEDDFAACAFPPLDVSGGMPATPPDVMRHESTTLWAQSVYDSGLVGMDVLDAGTAAVASGMVMPAYENAMEDITDIIRLPWDVSSPSPALPFPPESSVSALQCSSCSRHFSNKNALRKHVQTHTRPHACPVCGKGHGAKRDKNRHMWTHHPDEAAKINIQNPMSDCPHCSRKSRHDNLKRHIRTQHPSLG